jgi:hypothetical protein
VINNTTYYLTYTTTNNWWQTTVNGPTLSTTRPTNNFWQFDGNHLYAQVSGGWGGGTTNYYLRYNSNRWELNNSNTTLNITSSTNASVDVISSGTTAAKITVEVSEYIDNDSENVYYDENGDRQVTGAGITYIPLSFDDENGLSVSASNTGYIVGAQWGSLEKGEFDGDGGNIRISEYAAGRLGGSTTPLTMTYNTGGVFKAIDELPEKKEDITPAQREMLAGLGLVKYADCYEDYLDSVTNYCYGLHFMEASVTKDNVSTITARLNGKVIDNYEVATNCIDFNLYDSGFINFVAGTYYTTPTRNNSFFSIYEITRDPDNEKTIKDIKEIRKIYAAKTTSGAIDTSKEYHYTYLIDGAEVGADAIPAGYEMVFDCRWITHPDQYTNWDNSDRAYYFEVPVNKGEYAIGSTEGRTGAYLVYLDLAANAQLIEREKQYEEITENSASATIPNGVDLLDPKAENFGLTLVNPSDSAFASIGGTTSGSIKYDKEGNVVKHTATSGTTAEYVGAGGKLVDGKGNVMTVPWTSETLIKRTTYRDNNINTGVFTVTVIDEIHVTEGGKETISYKKHVTTTYPTGHEDYPNGAVVEKDFPEQSEPLHPDTKDDVALKVGENKLIDIAFSYGSEVNLTVSYEYVPAGKDANGNVITPAGVTEQIPDTVTVHLPVGNVPYEISGNNVDGFIVTIIID